MDFCGPAGRPLFESLAAATDTFKSTCCLFFLARSLLGRPALPRPGRVFWKRRAPAQQRKSAGARRNCSGAACARACQRTAAGALLEADRTTDGRKTSILELPVRWGSSAIPSPSCRSQRTALKCSFRGDEVTRNGPVALKTGSLHRRRCGRMSIFLAAPLVVSSPPSWHVGSSSSRGGRDS